MMKFYAKVLKYIFTNVSLIISVVKGAFVQKKSNLVDQIAFIFVLCLLPLFGTAQVFTFSSTNPAVPSAYLAVGATNQPIYHAAISADNSTWLGWGQNINQITFTPSGTFVAGDFANCKYWYNTTDNFVGATLYGTTVTPTVSGATLTIDPYNTPYINAGTTLYIWITVDVLSTATVGHTLTVGALTTGNISLTGGTKTGSMSIGGTQIIASQQQFNTTGSFTVPNNVYFIQVEAWGAGGGGGGSTASGSGGSGGGGGAYCINIRSVIPGQVINYTVGTGGAGGNYGTGGLGGSSTISSTTGGFTTLTANGGTGGKGNAGAAGTGGTASGGSTNTSGGAGTTGGSSGGNGGNGAYGGTGGNGSTNNSGSNGNAPGGGGGGGEASYSWWSGTINYSGGSGGDGQVAISWIPSSITTSISALSGFNYIYDFGPSAEQSFSVNGFLLGNNITITPPVHYEISTTSGSGFQSTPITLTQTGGVVNNTTIYVRLKAGYTVNTYGPENIALSAGLISTNVICTGFVSAVTPYITAGGGYTCTGNTIALTSTSAANISNQYWTGPNGFYSTLASPTIASPTGVNSGVYTVTGSILSGVNLVTNGDFEAGNTGFTSEYTNWPIGTPGDMSEGRYSVVKLPSQVHANFCSGCGDHTSGTGNQMVVNAASSEKVIWSPTQPIAVTPNTDYQFTYWVQTAVNGNDASPSQLQLFANTVPVGPKYVANATTGVWKLFIYNWNSGSNTTVNLQLKNENFTPGGNDFALDDIVFQSLIQVSSKVNVTVGGAAATLSIAASSNPATAGANVTFTATPGNGGSAPSYQWKVNGVNVGTNSPTYSYVPNNGDAITCVMTSNSSCVTGSPVTSNTITMTMNGTKNLWIGTPTSTQWNVASNWKKGVIPSPGDDVEFATAGNNGGAAAQNDLVVDVNHTVGNLINQTTNRTLIINPTNILFVNQSVTTSSADRIYIKSSSSQPNGSLIFHNAQANPATATVEFYIKGVHSNTPAVANSINYFYSWQFFGIPFRSGTASPSFDGYYVRSYDESKAVVNGKWTALTNSSVMNSFGGYEITQTSNSPTTVAIQGTLENSSQTIPLPYTAGAYDPGQNILSNPYTAAIDIRQLVFTNAEPTVYLYNTGSFGNWYNANGEGLYSTTSSAPGTYIAIPKNSAGTGGIPYDIPSMSGFLVKSTGLLGSLKINYSSVITKNVSQQRAPQNRDSESPKTTDKVYLAIALRGEYSGDNMWLINEPGTTHGYDNGWDGYKLSGFAGTPQLFAMEESGNYQVSVSEDLNNTYLGFQAGADLEDTLTFHSENLEKQYSGVYLIDLVEKKVVNITQSGSKYSFKSESTPSPVKRFKITTEPYIKDAQDLNSQIKLFNDNETVFVENLSNEKGELYVYDIMGRYLKKETFGPNSISSYSFPLTSGAYVIKAQSASEKVSKRIIVKHQGE